MGELLTPTHLIVIICMLAFVVVPFWQIFKKAGFGAPLSLLMVIPLANIIMLYIVAFFPWNVIPNPKNPAVS